MTGPELGRLIPRAVLALRCIGYGDRFRDKLVICLHLGLYLVFPIGVLARRLGHGIPDPMRHFSAYRCRCPDGTFECPTGQGPYFVGCAPGYEAGVMHMVRELQGGTVLDIGANIGFITVRAARILEGRGRVIAVEPHPVRFTSLKRNIELNGLTNVTALPCAAAATNGSATIYDLDPSLGPHKLDVSISDIGGTAIRVETRTVDDILLKLAPTNVALVKIDVEGFESEVIAGMTRTLETLKPTVVFEALNSSALRASSSLLEQFDYHIRQLDEQNYVAKAIA